MSTTTKIKTAERKQAIPIQALAVRSRKDLEEAAKNAKKDDLGGATLSAPTPKKDEMQGVFMVSGKKAYSVLSKRVSRVLPTSSSGSRTTDTLRFADQCPRGPGDCGCRTEILSRQFFALVPVRRARQCRECSFLSASAGFKVATLLMALYYLFLIFAKNSGTG